MRNNREKLLKIDVYTIETLQLLAPGISTRDRATVKDLVLSGAVFSNFTQSERSSIWKKMKKKDHVIPSLHTFFRNMRYLKSCADCIKRLVVFSQYRSTVKSAMGGIFRPADLASRECLIQTSETGFRQYLDPQADHAELGYRQLWLYAMRHYPKLAKDPESDDLVAKPGCEKADETVLYNMAALAQKLGFDSPQIRELTSQSPDHQIARATLLKARKPDQYRYGDSFESHVGTIVGCFSLATPIDHHATREQADGREVQLNARCGHPHAKSQKQDSQFLFVDKLHAEEFPTAGKVSSLFVRRDVYCSFFGKPQIGSLCSSAGIANGCLALDATLSSLFVPHEPMSHEEHNRDRQHSCETRGGSLGQKRKQLEHQLPRRQRQRQDSLGMEHLSEITRGHSSATSDAAFSVESDAFYSAPSCQSLLSEEVGDG